MRPAVALAAALLLLAAPAQAFRSLKDGGSPHDEITAVAEELGWPEDAVEALQAAVRQPDIDDLEPAPIEGFKDRVDASPTFRPWHHCDRVPPQTDAEALNATRAYVAHERGLAKDLALLDPPAAMRALGRALHALQDCFSHSDVVDLPPERQQDLVHAFVNASRQAPPLRLCGTQPGAPIIGQPPGDPYPHATCNKDDPKSSPEAEALMPDGRSKHEHARELATEATRAFLTDVMAGLEAEESRRLLAVDDDDPEDEAAGIPAPPAGLLLAALAAVGVLRRD